MARGIMVAGTTSGVGKTTVTMGLIGALKRRGMRVQPFKAGPDYIDPTYHSRIAGVPCRNLDTWLVSRDGVVDLFARAMRGMELAVVEGVMGLFDGRSGGSEEGSSAELAKLLGLPVILVVNAHSVGRSAAAIVTGFLRFDPDLHIVGVVLNGVGSEGHAALCREAIEGTTGVPVLGALPRREDLILPERHLGLVPTVEGTVGGDTLGRVIEAVEQAVDISRVLTLAEMSMPPASTRLSPRSQVPPRTRIAVAMDNAFSFYYQDSLDLLEVWGAELAPFSPMCDPGLPHGTAGVYLGGGFPELYARELAGNRPLLASVRKAAERGVPIYAECGGLMYLGQSITDFEGVVHPMVGLIPARSRLTGARLTLGYRTVRALSDGPLLRQGQQVRGHEFHWSSMEDVTAEAAYEIVEQHGRREGFQSGSVLASYVHLHMASDPGMAPRFVEACQTAQEALR